MIKYSPLLGIGTALADDHFQILKNLARKVVLAYDSDAAGQSAAEKWYGWEQRYEIQLEVADLPAGKDPADVWRAVERERVVSLPVVGETCDIVLNDMHGQHVRPEHVEQAFADADDGPVEQGAVGGGTGMICHGFKGGIGSASRNVDGEEGWTVDVLIQANHGMRERLTIDGVAVGQLLGDDRVPLPKVAPGGRAAFNAPGEGSIIVVIATDAPLLAPECAALAKRATFGIARTGGAGERTSGDFGIAFSTTSHGSDDLAGAQVVRSWIDAD